MSHALPVADSEIERARLSQFSLWPVALSQDLLLVWDIKACFNILVIVVIPLTSLLGNLFRLFLAPQNLSLLTGKSGLPPASFAHLLKSFLAILMERTSAWL